MARSEATKPSRGRADVEPSWRKARLVRRHRGALRLPRCGAGGCSCGWPRSRFDAEKSPRRHRRAAKSNRRPTESAIGEPPRGLPTPPSLKSAFIGPNQRDASFFACVRRRGRFSLFRSPTHPLSPCCPAKQAPLCACYCPPCFLPPNSRIVSEALVKERFFRPHPGREARPSAFSPLLAGRNRRSSRPNSRRSPLASRRPFPTRRPNAFDTPSTAHSRSCCLRTPRGPLPEQAQPHPASLPAPYRCRLSPCAFSQASARSVSGQTRRRRLQNPVEWLRWTRWATSCAAR